MLYIRFETLFSSHFMSSFSEKINVIILFLCKHPAIKLNTAAVKSPAQQTLACSLELQCLEWERILDNLDQKYTAFNRQQFTGQPKGQTRNANNKFFRHAWRLYNWILSILFVIRYS